MRSSIVIPMAVLTLALSASPAAFAADSRDWNRDRDRRSAVRYDPRRVAVLAHELEQTAASIHRQAERNNRRPDRWEARMLAALHELNEEAERFHEQVESRHGSPRSAERDFEDLVETYWRTGDVLDRVEPRPYVDRGMERIGSLLHELSGYYGGRSGDRFGYDRRGNGRNDHRGYDHRGYDRDGRGRDRDRYDRDGDWREHDRN
jgi:hypothetical protein